MTNCLFARGLEAVTAEMAVRFRHPTAIGQPVMVQAHIARSQPPLHVVEAQTVQAGRVTAKAQGKFMERCNTTYVTETHMVQAER
jgi:acyl-CoA thioesterase FadM